MANQDWFAKGRAALAALAAFSLFTIYTQTIALAQTCEATGGATCYYVSPTGNDDTGDGSFANPWQSQLNFVYYYDASVRDANAGDGGANYVDLQSGDYVYFRAGTYSTVYDNTNGSMEGTGYEQLRFRSKNQTAGNPITLKAYPGETVTLQGGCGDLEGGEECEPIHIQQSDGFVIDGINIVGGDTFGIYLAEADNVTIKNLSITDVKDGSFNADNGACIGSFFGGSNITIQDVFLKDCVDSANNATLITLFGGTDNVMDGVEGEYTTIHGNGRGVLYKAGDEDAVVTVQNSTFKNFGEEACLGFAQRAIVDNVLCWNDSASIKGKAISLENFANFTWLQGVTITNLTAVNTQLFYMEDFNDNLEYSGTYSITDSVAVTTGSFGSELAYINIDPYGSDAEYDIWDASRANWTINNNCYYSTDANLRWAVFSASGGEYGVDGAAYTSLATWQSGEGFDINSFVEDPQLNGSYVAQSSNCAGKGYIGEGVPYTPTTTGPLLGVLF